MPSERCSACGGELDPGLALSSASLVRCSACDAHVVPHNATAVPLLLSQAGGPGQVGAQIDLTPEFTARYRLRQVLGQGSMGTVYLAEATSGERVAIKFLTRLNEQLLARFLREGHMMSKIRHPCVVRVTEVGQVGAFPYQVCELVDGGTLRARMNQATRMPVSVALPIVLDVLDGIEACHARGVIHRDLKPENILLTRSGRAKVADFGLARDHESQTPTLTERGAVMGTPTYMSPEQTIGEKLGAASDVYSVGAMLYEMLAGRPPHVGRDLIELFTKIRMEDPQPLIRFAPDVGADLSELIQRALAKAPTERPASAAAFRTALAPAPKPAAASSERPDGARGPMFGALLALTLLGIGLQGIVARRLPDQPQLSAGSPSPAAAEPAPQPPQLVEVRARREAEELRPIVLKPWDTTTPPRRGEEVAAPLLAFCLEHVERVRVEPGGGAVVLPDGHRVTTPLDLKLSRTGLVEGLNWVRLTPGPQPATVRLVRGPCPAPIAVARAAPPEFRTFDAIAFAMKHEMMASNPQAAREVIATSWPAPDDPLRKMYLGWVDLDGEDVFAKFTEYAAAQADDPLWNEGPKGERLRQALRAVQGPLTSAPGRWDLWHLLGYFLHKGGHHELGIAALVRSLTIWPESVWSWRELGRTEKFLWSEARDLHHDRESVRRHRESAVRCLELARRFLDSSYTVAGFKADIESELAEMKAGTIAGKGIRPAR